MPDKSSEKLTVAVYMVTYNHEKYIRQAVESIVSQKTNFPYKLFIGEDFSTDSTRSICIELKQKYPEKIELLLSDKNIGALQNAVRVYEFCISHAKYTAICEGDDYWTDTNKLQKQVDFLEANPDFNICCHRAKILYENKKMLKTPKRYTHDVYTQEDVANHNFIQTVTEVFRNSAWKELSEGYFRSISGDYFINMMLSETGKIKYFPDVMAVYRVHDSGSWQSLNAIQGNERTLSVLNYYLETDLRESIKQNLKRNIVRHHIKLYDILKRNKKQEEAEKSLLPVLSSEFSHAWNEELELFINTTGTKEYKIGQLLLKPYFTFRNILSRLSYFFHRMRYE